MAYRRRVAVPIAGLLLLILLGLSGCNFPGATATPDVLATAAAKTVAAHLTLPVIAETGTLTPTPEVPAITPVTPQSTDSPTGTADRGSATPTLSGCSNLAFFISDVSIPDDTRMAPGESFVKTWRLRNVGTCTWSTGYSLIFANSGHIMGGPAEGVPFPGVVPPGASVDLSVGLTAPAAAGSYRGVWQLRSNKGELFRVGSQNDKYFWVQIVVGPTPTATFSPSPTATATASATPTPEPAATP